MAQSVWHHLHDQIKMSKSLLTSRRDVVIKRGSRLFAFSLVTLWRRGSSICFAAGH